MLVLTRKPKQEIQIAKDVWVTVLEIRGNRVKIGVSAPRDVEIRRAEVGGHEENCTLEIVPKLF